MLRASFLFALTAGCATQPVHPDAAADAGPPLVPGISGSTLAGHLEVDLVDDITGEPISLPITIGLADGSTLDASPGVIDDARLVPPISIAVAAPGRPQRWDGIAGSRVVVGLARESFRSVTGRVDGASGANEIRIRTLAPARLVRTEQFDRGDSMSCSPADCTFDLLAPATATGAAAVMYAASEPIGAAFARGPGALAIDARAPSIAADVGLPPPPAGLSEVVGVPGISIDGQVALLGYTQVGHFVAPEISEGSYWLLARAQSTRGEESVVFQRGLASLADARAWSAWLDPPAVTVAPDGTVTVTATGASIVAIDWLGGSEPTSSVLVIAPAGATIAAPPASPIPPSSVRVRALDVPGVTAAAFDLAAVDRGALRYSQVEVSITP